MIEKSVQTKQQLENKDNLNLTKAWCWHETQKTAASKDDKAWQTRKVKSGL